ncbi:hypothetical protein DV737_g437, partial [Chaetothyriales sp. CBS 132003]
MDISGADFPREILRILEEVSESHFIAFDLEFSGVARWRPAGSHKLSLQEYYEDIKAAAEKYQILQAGFTLVTQDVKKNRYVARPYNFNVSPLPTLRERHFGREWSCHSGAVSFLARNGFKFDEPISSGVHYLSRSEEQLARRNMIGDEQSRSKIGDMDLKAEDDVLVQHIRSELRRWQARAKSGQDEFLNIPGDGAPGALGTPAKLNRYQVRLTHQIVRNEYPGLKTVGMGHFVQVTNPTTEQQASQRLAVVEARENEIAKAIGLRWLIEGIAGGSILNLPREYLVAGLSRVRLQGQSPQDYLYGLQEKLRRRRRILVGHNCLTDLVNLYKCFFGPLPATVDGFASAIHDLFPGVIDTKVLASFSAKTWANTSLEDVELDLKRQERPTIHVPAEYDGYAYTSKHHEAGYDSLLTATVAIKLSAKLEREHAYVDRAEAGGSQGGLGGFGSNDDEFYDARTGCGHEHGEEDEAELEPGSPPAEQDDVDVPQVKSKLATPNMYDLLGTDEGLQFGQAGPSHQPHEEADRRNRRKQDTMPAWDNRKFWAGPSHQPDEEVGRRKQDMMPAWDNRKFWAVFGNKLQVNGSKEGVCKLE